MWHMGAFTESITNNALTQVNALQDDFLTIANDNFLIEGDWALQFFAGLGTDLQRLKLIQPNFRRIAEPYVRPIIGAASTPSDPNVADFRQNPLRLKSKESFSIQALQDSAGAQQVTGVFGISKGLRPEPSGPLYWLRGTGTTTVSAAEWTSTAITWENDLEGGKYAVVALSAISATGIAARLMHQSQTERPGCLAVGDENERTHEMFNTPGLGTYLEFESDVMPQVQFLCSAADTAQTIYLGIIQIRST